MFPILYVIKLFYAQLLLSDLWQADADLARGLKFILEYPDGLDAIETVLGTTFTASSNPLILNRIDLTNSADPQRDTYGYVDLTNEGSARFVNRGNRLEYVDLFIKYALHGCCIDAIDRFFAGLGELFPDKLIKFCATEEVSIMHRTTNPSYQHLFSYLQLEHIICGSPDIGDLSELRVKTIYRGKFNDEHPIINWFWVGSSVFFIW